VKLAGPEATLPSLTVIVVLAGPQVPADDARAALARDTPDPVDIRTLTIGDVNAAVNESDARFLGLLDARVRAQHGWCEPLLGLLQAKGGRDEAVAATSCVIDSDGSVIEAGTMVARDGAWYPIGAGMAADDPGVRFARTVDGSSRVLVLERDAFLRIGGFDDRFSTFPAAAMDLCLRLVEQGGTVWYEPASRMAWAPVALDAAEAERIEADGASLRERRPATLEQRALLEDLDRYGHRAVAIRDALALDRVLVIDERVPHHDRGAGDPRMRQILEEMITLWPQARITFLAADQARAGQYAPAFLEQGIEVAWPPDIDAWLTARLFHYSIVVVSRPANFYRFDSILRRTQPQALRVFDVEALFYRRFDRMKEFTDSEPDRDALRELLRHERSWELTAAAEADAAWCVTPEEEEVVSAVAPDTPRFPVAYFAPARPDSPEFSTRRDLVFFGGFLAGAGSPNEDAVLYVVEEIMPRLWKHDPTLKLHVVGADPTAAVRSLDSELIDVVGHVDDPRRWLDRTLVHVAPMRFGSGLKLRFVETIAAGQPLVTSSVGAEGLGLGGLTDALVADDADAQASLVMDLVSDRSRWDEAKRGVLAVAAEKFSRERFRSDLVEAMSHLGVAPPTGFEAR
jgi:glycosyltransferase involved in cell wall biosynthesis